MEKPMEDLNCGTRIWQSCLYSNHMLPGLAGYIVPGVPLDVI